MILAHGDTTNLTAPRARTFHRTHMLAARCMGEVVRLVCYGSERKCADGTGGEATRNETWDRDARSLHKSSKNVPGRAGMSDCNTTALPSQ